MEELLLGVYFRCNIEMKRAIFCPHIRRNRYAETKMLIPVLQEHCRPKESKRISFRNFDHDRKRVRAMGDIFGWAGGGQK